MYSTVRYPRALRFTAENRLLRPSMKAVVKPWVQWAKIPSMCPSIIRAARAMGSSNSPVCSLIAFTQAHQFPNSFLATSTEILQFSNKWMIGR